MKARALIRRGLHVLPIPLGLLLSGALVWQASYSAFSSTTSNSPNTWSTTTVNLTNDSTSSLFTITNMSPGQTGFNCIQLTSTSTVATTLKLYTAIGSAPANDVSSYITITIEQGSGGLYNDCSSFSASSTPFSGTLSSLTSTATNYSNGVAAGSFTGTNPPQTTSYRITWTFSSSAPNSTQGGSTPTVTFTWEAQN